MGHVLEGGEVGGRVIGSDAAFIVAEDHIHHPMQAVLDRPVAADDGAELAGEPGERGDEEAGLALDPAFDFARALDHDDALQPRPVVALFEPIHIVDRGVGPRFDAAVVAVDGFVPH